MNRQDIFKTIDSKKDDIVKFAQKLIQIKTVNPPGYTNEIANFINEYITERGLICDFHEPENKKVNVIGTLKGKGDKKFLWNGHLDVVPANKTDGWTVDPWEGTINNSKIIGRGAADMKGSIAAAISAACILAESGEKLSGDWILGLTVDEETGGEMGAEYILNNDLLAGDACIIGESSAQNRICVGEKGVLWLKVKADIDIRILPGMTHEMVMEEVQQILTDSGLKGIKFEIMLKANSSYQPLDNPFVEFMKEIIFKETNHKPKIFINPGFTDARFFREKGIPTVIYGCDGQNHHGVDEFITVDSLISTTKAYATAVMNFLK